MATSTMLTRHIDLDSTPGAIPPIVHFKKDTTSSTLEIYVIADGPFNASTKHFCVIKGTRPDGSELYLEPSNNGWNSTVSIHVSPSNIKEMTKVVGKYLVEITIFDSRSTVKRKDVSEYDTITSAKFWVDVIDSAYGEEEA